MGDPRSSTPRPLRIRTRPATGLVVGGLVMTNLSTLVAAGGIEAIAVAAVLAVAGTVLLVSGMCRLADMLYIVASKVAPEALAPGAPGVEALATGAPVAGPDSTPRAPQPEW